MKICEISVKRPVAVTMIVLIFVVLGMYSMSMLPMEMTPEIDLSMAIVYTSYPNVGPEEVENLVTKNIESAVSSVSGIEEIMSQTSEGSSFVILSFASGTDMDKAISDIEGNINMISSYLPDAVTEPIVMKLDTSAMPIFMMSASYEGYDVVRTKQYIEDNVKNKLEAIDGVASVSIMGAEEREIDVVVDPEKVFGYGVSLTDVANSIAAQNVNLPAGSTEGMNKNLAIRTVGKFEKVKEIESVPIITPQGQIIHIRDVATVHDTYSEESSYARLNKESAISISITKESDANTVDVVGKINAVLDGVTTSAPKFSYNVIMEQASYIEDSISSVASNAITGAILAIVILILFLSSIKTSLVIGLTMPVSVITTFVAMYFSGISLNVVSLGGLALGVGMLVDNAVVVLENIFRRKNVLGEDSSTASIVGAAEVAGAVLASVITTCIVYVPIMFIDNMMAVMFKQLAFSIIFSQIASIIVTFLLVPMLSSKIKSTEIGFKPLKKLLVPVEKLLDKMYGLYERTLAWVLAHKKRFIISVLGIFVLSMVVLGLVGMTLMPSSDEGTFTVSVTLPEGSLLEDTNEITTVIEDKLLQNEYVDTVFTNVGSGGMSAVTGASSTNASSLTVTLKENRKKSTVDIMEEIRPEFADIAGAEITLSASSASSMMSSEEVEFQFTGTDDEKLEEYVLKAEEVLAQIDGVTETETSISEKKSEVRIKINKDKASNYGLTTATATSLISQLTSDTTASRYLESGSEYDIVVKYPEDYVENYNQLKTMRIKTPLGQWIAVGDIADVTIEEGATTLNRVNQKRTVTLSGKIYGSNMGTVNREFEAALKHLPAPDGISRTTSGTFEVMMDAMKSLLLAIVLGILLMYMVMAAQFENFVHPFIILFTIPLAMIGVVIALVLSGEPLSVIGCIGILMLGGIIVNNAIVLIDFVNTSKKENPEASLREHVMNAGITRLRPILMTSLTSILGFMPMAFSTASGSEMMRPLATVLLGGLTVGTFLTLYFIPAVYIVVEARLEKKRAKKA